MIQNQAPPTKDSPQLLDVIFDGIATELLARLSWLDNAYGKVERQVSRDSLNRLQYEPVIFTGGRLGMDYISMLPDSHLGCYSWFDVPDAQEITLARVQRGRVSTTTGLIFWWDYRKVYPTNHQSRTVENVKSDILAAMRATRISAGMFRVVSIEEKEEQIYRRYNTKNVDQQFMMRPYGALRLNLQIRYDQTC